MYTLSGGIRIILWFRKHWKLNVLMTLHRSLNHFSIESKPQCSGCLSQGTRLFYIFVCKVCSVYCSHLHPPPRHTHLLLCSAAHIPITSFLTSVLSLAHILLYFALIVTFSLFLALLHGLSVSIGGHGLGKRFEQCSFGTACRIARCLLTKGLIICQPLRYYS